MARAGLINADLRSIFPGQLYAAVGWWGILRGVAGAAMVDKLKPARVQDIPGQCQAPSCVSSG